MREHIDVKFEDILAQLRKSWPQLLIVHLLFTLLGVVILAPVLGFSTQALVELSGSAAVADQDIARLMLTPLGMLGLIFILGLFLAIVALELSAMLALVSAHRRGLQVLPRHCVVYVARNAPRLLLTTMLLVMRTLLYLLPFIVVVAGIAWWLLTDYDINYYLSEKPAEFYYAIALAALPTLLFVWRLGRRLLGWSLVLPLVMFNATAPRESFAVSESHVSGDRRTVVRSLVFWVVSSLLLAAVPAIFLGLAWQLLLAFSSDSLTVLVLLLGMQMVIWAALNFFASALSVASLATVIVQLQESLLADLVDSDWLAGLSDGPRKGFSVNWSTRRIVSVAVLAALIAAGAGHVLVRGLATEDTALVIAHRGAAGAAPENTLAAIRRAVQDGADWVEIDVQESRDGEVIVVHDSDFMKLAGNPLKTWEGDLAEIQQIDIGSWFSPEFAGERTPTLAQVLTETRGKAKLLIELKYYGHDEALERRVVDVVEQMDMADEVIAMSLHLPGVEKLKALRPQWTVGLLAATAVGDLSRLDVDFLAVNAGMATPAFIRRSQDAGKPVYVWTINDALSMTSWLSRGVDGLITDEPAMAGEVMAQRAQLGPTERLLLSASLFFGKPVPPRTYRDNSP